MTRQHMASHLAAAFDLRSLAALRVVGDVLPPDVIAEVISGGDLPGLDAGAYHLELRVTPREAANRAWAVLRGAWTAYQDALAAGGGPATGLTREKWLSVLLRELGFGRVPATPAGGLVADGRAWPVSHLADGRLPIHLLGWGVDLDHRTRGLAGAAERPPHAMLQELLNRSDDYLWALLANGATLRILRDSSTLVGPSYVEFDLAAIFDGELFSDFVALYLLCHQSRFEPTDADLGPVSCWLERWRTHAVETGARALGALRIGVHDAIEALGTGLVAHPANATLRDDLDHGRRSAVDLQQALLRLVYRILFCFVAEDRDLLLDPDVKPDVAARFHQWYSTARLRRIAIRRAGDLHGDHWQALRLVLDSLGKEEGCLLLGLVGLGGVFEAGPVDLDPHLALHNRALLGAVRHLSVTRPVPGGPRRLVDYRHLGAEELGGIYESLLEYVPRYDGAARTFTLVSTTGNDRKKTGAYYTPSSLTENLLDSALEPLVDRAERQADPEAALLSLTVCDPACGSGHFLVAAGRRIAARLAVVRAEGAEPTVEEAHRAMHDVVAHCLYGVDVNPLAAELAKVSLWLEGLQAGLPLSLLDGHIKIGNALLGTTPALLAGGIPDEAFAPIEGDDRKTAAALKKRNKAERSGQGRFGHVGTITVGTSALAAQTAAIEALVPRDLADVHVAARRLRDLAASPDALKARRVADAWCAAFVLPKLPDAPTLTHATLEAIQAGTAASAVVEAIDAVGARYRWFHWHLEYPHIFTSSGPDADPDTGWGGGFDCVVGNPPWEHVELKEQEWFASRMPAVADAAGDERKQLIAALTLEHPDLFQEYRAALRQVNGERAFLGNSGRYPLAGRGRINTYAVFAETDRSFLGPTGRLGVILPTGIATDATTQYFFKDLVTSRELVSLYDFENRDRLFDAVDSRMKFCLLTLTGRRAPAEAATFAFFAHHPDDLGRDGVGFTLTPAEITLLNPNTGTCPVFRTRRDAEITLAIYRRHPVLIRHGDSDGNPWGLSFMQGLFNMTNDSGLFHARDQLERSGWTLDGNIFSRGSETMLPLYQGLMADFYDHRSADVVRSATAVKRQNQPEYLSDSDKDDPYRFAMPAYWVARSEVEARINEGWKHDWLVGFSNITSPTNNRSMTPYVIPRVGVGHSTPLVFAHEQPFVLASLLSSISLDYVVRQKLGGTNMTYNYVEQIAAPPNKVFSDPCMWSREERTRDWIEARLRELVYTAWDMAGAALDLGEFGSPFRWYPQRRLQIRAELDAAFFHLYGIDRGDTEYILSTFPIANRKDPDLAGRILAAYDGIVRAVQSGKPFASALDPPPGQGPRHPARST